jgi:RNA polymerase sigma-70 factor (ECF subfamily)
VQDKPPILTPEEQSVLFNQIASGDQLAFARLLRIYGDRVFSQAMAYTKSVVIAEEITQDTFLRVWKNRQKLEQVNNFESWLFIIARNRIFKAVKTHFNEPFKELVGEDATADHESPESQAEARDAYRLLVKAIELLPEKRQQVFRMSRLEHMSHREIAEKLGIHEVTVGQYIVKAVSFLREYLEKHTGDTILVIILLRGLP